MSLRCWKSLRPVQRERDNSRACTRLAIDQTAARKRWKTEPTNLSGGEVSISSANPAWARGSLAGTKPDERMRAFAHAHRNVLCNPSRKSRSRAPRASCRRQPLPRLPTRNQSIPPEDRRHVLLWGRPFAVGDPLASGTLRASFGRIASVPGLTSFDVLEPQSIRFGPSLTGSYYVYTHINSS